MIPQLADQFVILSAPQDASEIVGDIDASEVHSSGGYRFACDYGGNRLTLTVVPEPARLSCWFPPRWPAVSQPHEALPSLFFAGVPTFD